MIRYTKLALRTLIASALISLPPACSSGNNATSGDKTMNQSGSPSGTELHFTTWDGRTETATFTITGEQDDLRSYSQASTAKQREDAPQSQTFSEDANWPRVRSGDLAFDALFALAVDEMKHDAVSEIRDSAYMGGEPIPCKCFETGAKWHFVWTRDLSYAAWLSLAMLDPERVRNSLEFKLSGYREGVNKPAAAAGTADGLQIIQDTGSGGSWPVSTDRVTWAFGAEAALYSLPAGERKKFAAEALKALSNTLDNDLIAAYEPSTGLYGGEQSFLDWRKQTYATWIPDDMSSLATAVSVSTNAAFYQAMSLAVQLARELGQPEVANKYQARAEALKTAINEHLWLEDAGLYSSLTASHFDGAPMHKFDWLGQALAIITGIADDHKVQKILASYPHGPMGAPVIFPQQPGIAVYHNRAIWPFVTAYGLKAAKRGNNVAVANSAMELLIRGAALNLSNMENLEWLSAQAMWQEPGDPALSGPVINSKRQLWSVGAYLSLVVNDIFGVETTATGLRLAPYITSELRQRYLGQSEQLQLSNLRLWGKTLDLVIQLPPVTATSGVYSVEAIRVNGVDSNGTLASGDLKAKNSIEIKLGEPVPGHSAITRVDATPGVFDESVFAPYEPEVEVADLNGKISVSIIDKRNKGDIEYRLFRNGEQLAAGLGAGTWVDAMPDPAQSCYSAVAIFKSSGNRSHHSRPRCANPGQYIAVDADNVSSNREVTSLNEGKESDSIGVGLAVIQDWGLPDDSFSVDNIDITDAGRYAIQIRYFNIQHEVQTGITNGMKWLSVTDTDGKVVGGGVMQLPHNEPHNPPVYSTPVYLQLVPGQYSLSLTDFYNMSYLTNNQTYSAAGGIEGPVNRFDIYGVRVLPLAR